MRLFLLFALALAACSPDSPTSDLDVTNPPIYADTMRIDGVLVAVFDSLEPTNDTTTMAPVVLKDRLDDLAGLFLKETGATFHGLRDTYPIQRDTIEGQHPIYWVARYKPEELADLYLHQVSPATPHWERPEALDHLEELLDHANGVRGLLFTQKRGRTYPDRKVDAWHFESAAQAAEVQTLMQTHFRWIFPKTMPLYAQKEEVLYIFHSGNMGACYEMKPVYEIFNKVY